MKIFCPECDDYFEVNGHEIVSQQMLNYIHEMMSAVQDDEVRVADAKKPSGKRLRKKDIDECMDALSEIHKFVDDYRDRNAILRGHRHH